MTDEFGSDGGWEVAVRKEKSLTWLRLVSLVALLVAFFVCFYFGRFMLAAWVGGAMMFFALFSDSGHGRGAACAKAGEVVMLANVIVSCVARANNGGYLWPIPHVAIVAVGLTLVVIGGALRKRGK